MLFAAYHYYAFLTVLLWSSAYVFTKIGLEHFSSPALGFIRCLVASAVLLATFAAGKRPAPKAADLPWLALSGATGFALYLLAFNKGSELLNPTTSCIIISTAPIITALIALFCFKERLRASGWLAIAAAFGGVAVLMLGAGSISFTRGIYWMLLAAILISLYGIIQRKLARNGNSLTITTFSFIFATVFLGWAAPGAWAELRQAPAAHQLIALYLGIFPSALAYYFWTRAMALAPAAGLVASYMYLTPLLSLLLEYLVMKQAPTPSTLAGGGIILASLIIFAKKGKQK